MESLLLAVEQAIALGEFKKEYLDVVVWFFEEFALLVESDEIAVDEEVSWIVETVEAATITQVWYNIRSFLLHGFGCLIHCFACSSVFQAKTRNLLRHAGYGLCSTVFTSYCVNT